METKEIRILVYEFETLDELPSEDKDLVLRAREATEKAYAPYSKFHVGAAILLSNQKIIVGNNQENSAYPAGLCAERVAMFYANATYPGASLKTIAVSAKYKNKLVPEPVKPCGDCRQALLEAEARFKSSIKIILDGESKILVLQGIPSLLPLGFSPSSLD